MTKIEINPFLWMLAAMLAVGGAATAQDAPPPMTDEQAIRQVALDYMQGALTGDADRVARAVHGELNKVQVSAHPQTGRHLLAYNTGTTLLAFVEGRAAQQFADTDKAVDVTVFEVGNGIAAARAVGAPWYDLLQLARLDGQWRIVNVLWAPRRPDAESQTDDPATRSEVEKAATDFVDAVFAGDAERLARVLHPEVHKVLRIEDPVTGKPFLYRAGWSNLVESTRTGMLALPEGERNISVVIQDISHDLASVKIESAGFFDLVQMARVNGEWTVINDLWVPTPHAPAPNG